MTQPAAGIDLSAYQALVDKQLDQPEQYNYLATEDTIRHFAYAIADHNALYLDAAFARGTRWGGIVAPLGYLYSHGYSTWLRALPGLRDAEGRELSQYDNAGETWEYHLPVRPGDRVLSNGRIVGIEAKRGKRIGDVALVKTEMRYTNQRDELVATAHGVSFRFNAPKIAGAGGMAKSYPPMPPGQITRNVPSYPEIPGTYPTPTRRHDAQRYFEDVSEGDALPPHEIGPLSTGLLAKFHAAVMGIGWDQFEALQAGAIPDAFAPGPMRIPWFGTLLTKWAGPNAWIRRLEQRNQEWVLVGFKVICGGRIARKYAEGDRRLVDCEVWCDSELGFRTNTGSATIELPPRPR